MSDDLSRLRQALDTRAARVGVIGLGYVGLPVACSFAEAGFAVLGVDLKAERVALINAGHSPIEQSEPGLAELLAQVTREARLVATTDYARLAEMDVVLICVETPVGDDHRPRFQALERACRELGPVLKEGALVVVESTLAPGTMRSLVRTCLEAATGQAAGRGFFLAHCPERVMPGKLLANLRTVSRVVGGQTPEVAAATCGLYRHVVQADLDPTDLLTAELVKTVENAYRDVNIAFANEVALICAEVGADVWTMRGLVNKSPGRQMLLPGSGVGGHCIPKDPWLLLAGVDGPHDPSLIATARQVNERMPVEVASLAVECLRELGAEPGGAKIAVLGYTYLEDSDDTRNSPSSVLVSRLAELGCGVVVHDPYVPEYAGDVWETLADADCAIIAVAHTPYRELELAAVAAAMRRPALVDARRVFAPAALRRAGFTFRTLGVGSSPGSNAWCARSTALPKPERHSGD